MAPLFYHTVDFCAASNEIDIDTDFPLFSVLGSLILLTTVVMFLYMLCHIIGNTMKYISDSAVRLV